MDNIQNRFGQAASAIVWMADQFSWEIEMQVWSDAKARFSEFLDACITDGPQMVTMRGSEAAVLVPVEIWKRLQATARPSSKELLLSDNARMDIPIPPRSRLRRRPAGER